MIENKKKTLGERIIRVDGANFILIDLASIDPNLSEDGVREFLRLKSLAITAIERGTSDSVKMATTKD